ncbi:MAG: glycoside hydrolase family 88 protein [Marvinbryantia sp.]|mgnify:CR=1 FL=1|uniref:Glycosyl hydrolase, family 88 n=1 Tax=Marvinbryantia formatexigens DSM 14469 TaxID=478749 RepID=C6LBD0_9FIRM|nr:glycoside hydrolase family 88 protein [Marvinbryantia formatexigens]EET62261.1 glycosyl hydrolase, family 88 [Marvinbryantia formatexigens DSM 14469]UWO26419.1 glycoside hydrolase family 88 protein [Marvinbryantia formatexigens DSM 14469]SDF81801.1 unsaturated chondroitin disaccharide hydrolase [Marvinbryantia formatexigens]
MEKWIKIADLENYREADMDEVRAAMDIAAAQVERNLDTFTEKFPGANSFDNFYKPGPNVDWTTGFWTGEIWLAYENAKTEEERERLRRAGEIQVDSFLERIEKRVEVDHHDMGFLYSLSCVAAYKLTGMEKAKKAALLAADNLISRFQPVGEFIQAWGEMGAKDNYRFIIDCLLNLPLLYWASEETGEEKYRNIAEKHIHTALANVIREDDSTWHTFFMDPETGKPDHGATCQGYKDGSAWARGQAWGVYGTAVGYRYTKREEYIGYFKRVTRYFLEHLPEDLCPYWDLGFGDGDDEARDSSSAVIAVCGMLEMSKYLGEEDARYYTSAARKLLRQMIVKYSVKDPEKSNGLLLMGTYSKKSPYNTCTEAGVNECVIWGDYFYMEALHRLLTPDWKIYW